MGFGEFTQPYPSSKAVAPELKQLPGGGVTFKVSDAPPGQFQSYPEKSTLTRLASGNQGEIVACSDNVANGAALLPKIASAENGFAETVLHAYNNHYHLIIRPDDVWIALMVQFTFYMEANAEPLRHKFVAFPGKKQLIVSSPASPEKAGWTALAEAMSNEIAANIVDPSIREWAVPNFSTTTVKDRMAGAVTLMSSMKKYFDYVFMCGCGLPQVTLLGTVDDWKAIGERVIRFLEFDNDAKEMTQWIGLLEPVIKGFINTAEGKPDTQWWNSLIHRQGGGSFVPFVSGWMIAFCAFSETGQWCVDAQKRYVHRIPKGATFAPVKIVDLAKRKKYEAELHAGHIVGLAVSENPATVQPQIDWALIKPRSQKELQAAADSLW